MRRLLDIVVVFGDCRRVPVLLFGLVGKIALLCLAWLGLVGRDRPTTFKPSDGLLSFLVLASADSSFLLPPNSDLPPFTAFAELKIGGPALQGDLLLGLFGNDCPNSTKMFHDMCKGIVLTHLQGGDHEQESQPPPPPAAAGGGGEIQTVFVSYNQSKFHRIIQGFMIQGGEPTISPRHSYSMATSPLSLLKLSSLDQYKQSIRRDECTDIPHSSPYLLSRANTGTPHSNSAQFFITSVMADWLSGKHGVFGAIPRLPPTKKHESGPDHNLHIKPLPLFNTLQLLEQIQNLQTGPKDEPTHPVYIQSCTFFSDILYVDRLVNFLEVIDMIMDATDLSDRLRLILPSALVDTVLLLLRQPPMSSNKSGDIAEKLKPSMGSNKTGDIAEKLKSQISEEITKQSLDKQNQDKHDEADDIVMVKLDIDLFMTKQALLGNRSFDDVLTDWWEQLEPQNENLTHFYEWKQIRRYYKYHVKPTFRKTVQNVKNAIQSSVSGLVNFLSPFLTSFFKKEEKPKASKETTAVEKVQDESEHEGIRSSRDDKNKSSTIDSDMVSSGDNKMSSPQQQWSGEIGVDPTLFPVETMREGVFNEFLIIVNKCVFYLFCGFFGCMQVPQIYYNYKYNTNMIPILSLAFSCLFYFYFVIYAFFLSVFEKCDYVLPFASIFAFLSSVYLLCHSSTLVSLHDNDYGPPEYSSPKDCPYDKYGLPYRSRWEFPTSSSFQPIKPYRHSITSTASPTRHRPPRGSTVSITGLGGGYPSSSSSSSSSSAAAAAATAVSCFFHRLSCFSTRYILQFCVPLLMSLLVLVSFAVMAFGGFCNWWGGFFSFGTIVGLLALAFLVVQHLPILSTLSRRKRLSGMSCFRYILGVFTAGLVLVNSVLVPFSPYLYSLLCSNATLVSRLTLVLGCVWEGVISLAILRLVNEKYLPQYENVGKAQSEDAEMTAIDNANVEEISGEGKETEGQEQEGD